jgi:hypothetical protein
VILFEKRNSSEDKKKIESSLNVKRERKNDKCRMEGGGGGGGGDNERIVVAVCNNNLINVLINQYKYSC